MDTHEARSPCRVRSPRVLSNSSKISLRKRSSRRRWRRRARAASVVGVRVRPADIADICCTPSSVYRRAGSSTGRPTNGGNGATPLGSDSLRRSPPCCGCSLCCCSSGYVRGGSAPFCCALPSSLIVCTCARVYVFGYYVTVHSTRHLSLGCQTNSMHQELLRFTRMLSSSLESKARGAVRVVVMRWWAT